MNLVLISLTLLIPCISCIDQSFGSTPFQQRVHNLNRNFKNQFEEQKNLLGSPFVSPNACSVVAHSEPCSKTETKKWYFHSKRNKCVQSNSKEYCMVGPNSFRNENECSKCEKKQTDVCMLPKYPGKCGKGVVKTKRFYFDSTSKSCKWFEFCSNGNGNNFETLKACEQKCAKKHKPKATEKLNQCFEAPKKSSCTKSTSRFYFSLKQNRCVVEKNGCVSGRNAFESAKECVKKCPQIVVVSKKDRPAVCSSQPQKTSCRKQIEKTWYFDSRAGNCVQDIIISKKQEKINCVAGENAFFLQRDCEKKCQPQHTKKFKSSICQNPPSQASCALNKATSNEIRYYFDAKLKRCKPYTFCGDHSVNSFKDGPTCRNKCYATK